jgi:hypothetical protein
VRIVDLREGEEARGSKERGWEAREGGVRELEFGLGFHHII